MVEMTVTGLALDASNHSPIVLLRDASGRRQVPIWIDNSQAHNIIAGLKREQSDRPLTHDLIISLLVAAELSLSKVIIHAIEDNAFKAVLKLRSNKSTDSESKNTHDKDKPLIEIKARPSDAIALAIRAKCSIWMLEQVVSEASIPVNEEADAEDQNEFNRFVDDLRPADLISHLKGSNQIDQKSSESADSDPNK